MRVESWRESGRWIRYRTHRLFVNTCGSGPPVLVLHGFPTSSYDYTRLLPLLQDRYRFLLFDYPGFGFSDKPRRYPYSLFDYADAAEAVAAYFGVREALLLAHDIGDSVTLELMRRGALTITRVLMMNGSVLSIPFDDLRLRIPQLLLLNRYMGAAVCRLRLFRKFMFVYNFNKIFGSPLPPDELSAFWSLLRYNDGVGIYHQLLRYMPERWQHQHTWLAALQNHRAPLTLVWGQADPVATPAVADAVLARRPDARYIRLHNIGHYPHWEAPDVVAEALRESFG